MGSYDFVTADNLEKLFSGLDLATWQKVDLATLNQTQTRCCHIFAVSLCRWGEFCGCQMAKWRLLAIQGLLRFAQHGSSTHLRKYLITI